MDTILTYGASGPCVSQLCALARAAGLDVPQLTETDPVTDQVLDTVLAQLGLAADTGPRIVTPGAVYKGKVIDQTVWDELRAKAAANTGLQVPGPSQEAPQDVQEPAQAVPAAQQAPAAPAAAQTGAQAPWADQTS